MVNSINQKAGSDIEYNGLIGFYGKNQMEGMIGEIGCQLKGIGTVWFYDTLG